MVDPDQIWADNNPAYPASAARIGEIEHRVDQVKSESIANPAGSAQDILVRVGGSWAVLAVGSSGQQMVVRSDGTIGYINTDIFVSAWGGKFDGATDDTTAWKNAAEAAVARGGGRVVGSEGTSIVTGIPIFTGVHYMGKGLGATTVKLKAKTARVVGTSGDVFYGKEVNTLAAAEINGSGAGTSNTGVHDFSITDMTIDGNKENQTSLTTEGGCGVRLYGYHFHLKRVVITGCADWTWKSEWGGTAEQKGMESTFDDVQFLVSTNGVLFNGPHDSLFMNCRSARHTIHAIGFDLGPKSNGTELNACHPWAENEQPMKTGARLRGSGNKIIGGQYEGCYGGGASITCLNNAFVIYGAYVYTTGGGTKEVGRGIQLGSNTENAKGEAGNVTVSGGIIDVLIFGCEEGPIDFQKVANTSVKAIVYLPGHKAYIGTPTATCRLDIYNIGEGSSATGNIFKPVPFYGGGEGKGAQVQMSRKAGAAVDGDFAVEPADGTLQLDTTALAPMIRAGGGWRYISAPNVGPVKTQRKTTGSLAAKAEATITVTWTTAFADANYVINANVVEGNGNITIEEITYTAAEVKIKVKNNHATEARTGTLHVHAIHD